MEIEAAVTAAKPVETAIPVGFGEIGQFGPQLVAVDILDVRMKAAAENGKEIVETELADTRHLQFEQRILARIGVNRINLGWPLQGVIERVATGAGDHHHRILRPEVQSLAVDRRVFPAGVVDQRTRIERIENLLVDAVLEGQIESGYSQVLRCGCVHVGAGRFGIPRN